MSDLDLDFIQPQDFHDWDCDRFRTYDHGLRQGTCDCGAAVAVPALVAALRDARADLADERGSHDVTQRQRDDARAAIAAVREACVGVEDCDYATTVVANVLAALDVRHDPSATTTIPIDVAREHAWLASYALEMLVDTGDGTYHPIADALAKVRDLLDPSATTEGGAS